MRKLVYAAAVLFVINAHAQPTTDYKEVYRPQFHYTPALNWCNDPNGLVYNNGVYHLFHQYNPAGNVWGHMSWAHAVSKDLIHWKQLPLAIAEEKDTMIFSGTCVVDKNNSSGFAVKKGQVPMVAIYTGHIENSNQSQHLAYSLDNGLSWTKYEHNPIIDLHKKDFRDPKVFWYAPKNYWVMAVVFPVEHLVQFYSSKNLKQWTHLSDFGPAGDTAAVWECPDLTQVPVEGNPSQKKWLLQTSQNTSMQYFVGEFDGVHFINENPAGKILRPDYGPEYYAAIAYNQLPATQAPTAIGWVNNWNYANDIPTTPWKGAMSLPRTMSVQKNGNEWTLLQQPVAGIKKLRQALLSELKNKTVTGSTVLTASTTQCEIELVIQPGAGSTCGMRLATGNGHAFEIGYDAAKQELYIDRSKTAHQSFNKNFEKLSRYTAALPLKNKMLTLRIWLDNSVVEVFANNGEAVLTTQFFAAADEKGMEVFSTGEKSKVVSLQVWPMKTIW
ncbi:MAG: glycoside hydrolase family 32 protein [Chitinophagaceae bacterium]